MKKIVLLVSVAAASALSSCTLSNVKQYKEKTSEEIVVDETNFSGLNIRFNIGNCNISYGNVKKTEISVKYEFRGNSQKKIEEAKAGTKLEYEVRDDILYLEFSKPENKKWILNSYVSADVDIVLPEKEYFFDVESKMGDIYFDKVRGNFELGTELGDIELDSVTINGDADIESEVGDVKVSFDKIEKSIVYIKTEIGDITLDSGDLDVDEKKAYDKTAGGSKVTVDIGEKCTVKMNTDVGEIKLR